MQENSGLMVDTEKLTGLGDDLAASTFDKDFEALKNKMSTITESWLDVEGSHFSETFSSFMDDAKKINAELVKLGGFARNMSSGYEKTVQDYSNKLDKLG